MLETIKTPAMYKIKS